MMFMLEHLRHIQTTVGIVLSSGNHILINSKVCMVVFLVEILAQQLLHFSVSLESELRSSADAGKRKCAKKSQ